MDNGQGLSIYALLIVNSHCIPFHETQASVTRSPLHLLIFVSDSIKQLKAFTPGNTVCTLDQWDEQNKLKMTKRHSAFKIIHPSAMTVSYLVLALSSGCLVQFKGLFDQPALPLSLSLRVVRGECGAVVLISTAKHKSAVTDNPIDIQQWEVVPIIQQQMKHVQRANWTGITNDITHFLWMMSQSSV